MVSISKQLADNLTAETKSPPGAKPLPLAHERRLLYRMHQDIYLRALLLPYQTLRSARMEANSKPIKAVRDATLTACTAREETMIRKDFDRRAGEVSPAIYQRLDAPFRWFRHDNAARAMSRNGASKLGCEAAGIVGRVELYIINSQTAFAERFGEVAHCRQHQYDLLLVMPDVCAFFHHLHHQDGVTAWIEGVQRRKVQRQLVSENNSQDGHDGASPGPDAGRGDAARQRSERYFTFAQSRSHFFRQTKGRPQTTQGLVGRSALLRILAIGSPRHWLAAPVEKTAVGVWREFIDNGEQVSGRSWGRINLQPSRREWSG